MTTALATVGEKRFLLNGISWSIYEALLIAGPIIECATYDNETRIHVAPTLSRTIRLSDWQSYRVLYG